MPQPCTDLEPLRSVHAEYVVRLLFVVYHVLQALILTVVSLFSM